jgi:hypothetical protein
LWIAVAPIVVPLQPNIWFFSTECRVELIVAPLIFNLKLDPTSIESLALALVIFEFQLGQLLILVKTDQTFSLFALFSI